MSQLTFLSQPSSRPTTMTHLETPTTEQSDHEESEQILVDDIQQGTNTEVEQSQNENVNKTYMPSTSVTPSPVEKKRKREASLVEVLQKNQEDSSLLYETLLPAPEKNPIKKFFDSMGDIVSQFPPYLAAETRLKVCQVVTEMEMKMLSLSSLPLDTQTPSHSAVSYTSIPMTSDDSNS